MTNPDDTSGVPGGWRLVSPADVPFVYRLVAAVDPRWWRFSRGGLEPSHLLGIADGIAAGVIVHDAAERPVACGILADAGAAGTATFEYHALPEPDAERTAAHFAPEVIAAAFSGTPLRRLYHERFEGDPDLLGRAGHLFEVEVRYPDFALVDGRFEARTVSVVTAEAFAAWQEAST